MTQHILIKYFKYYTGEDEPPQNFNKNKRMWWYGEKELYNLCSSNQSYWINLKNAFTDALNQGSLSGILIDKSMEEVKRIIIFFLDIWHSKHFPYDSLDEINNY